MGRKVTENHKVTEQSGQGAAEDLIKQQAENFVLGKGEEDSQEADADKEADQQKEEQQEGDVKTAQEEFQQELPGDAVETREGSAELAEKETDQQKNVFEGIVVLTGAATYMDAGTRYFKNKPIKITDQRVYEQLLRTGLFVHI